jgi:hypothetical protein
MAYHYAKKTTVHNEPAPLPAGLHWVKQTKRPPYQVRSDAGGLNTRFDDCATLTDARRVARKRAWACGWAEVFRWAESAVQLRSILVAVYERELRA